jgi:hypothetical protein
MRITAPGLAARLWYRRLGVIPPHAEGSTAPRSAKWVRLLVPYRARRVHRWYAAGHRFYWLPCPLCNVPFGSHEAGREIPLAEPRGGRQVCSACTRAGLAS